MSIGQYLALDKLKIALKIISKNGGIIRSLDKLWRTDTCKEGTLVGCDNMGNKYYENQRYMIGRSRWVEYNPAFNWEYDASQVCPEWHGWLHYKTDRTPCEDWAKYCLWCHNSTGFWLQPAKENMTRTSEAYFPYSTVRPKIHVWDGCSWCNRPCC